MEAKPYPEAKRRLLLERSVEDFVAFLKEVTDSEGDVFIRNQLLPSNVAGFRPGRAPRSRTVPMLISNLRNEQEVTNPNSRIWDMFKNAWGCWVSSHQKLNNILTEFDNSADFDENQGSIVPPNSELDRQCFKVLLEASLNNRIAQETIQRFYEYGYFEQCDEIEESINRALPQDEIERRWQIEQLPDQVDGLKQDLDDLRSQVSNINLADGIQQVLDQRIAEVQQSIENQLEQLNVSGLAQSLESLKTRIGEIDTSLKTRIDKLESSKNETNSSINAFVEPVEGIIIQLEQQSKNFVKAIVEIKSNLEAGNRETRAPRIAHQAVKIGESAAAKLEERTEHYKDEEDYLSDFAYCLGRHGITDSDEIATAIHVALKAFPVLQITDRRIFKVWNLMCDEHLHYTNLYVEMGWLGLQDWFPKLLSEECFGEQLERNDLKVSIQKMLEMGNMLWAIHFRNCDRSFPESYLPSFLQWTKDISDSTIKVFVSRTSGNNRCEITEDAYALIARLPEPEEEEPIETQNLKSSKIIVTHSDWADWCQLHTNVDQHLQNQFDIVSDLRSTIKEQGVSLPIIPLQEIQHYVRLSQSINMAPTLALDWALTMRLLPWIEKQPKRIKTELSLLGQEYDDLQHFNKGLQQARKITNESN